MFRWRHLEEEQAMSIGPIQAFVIGFPDNDLFEGRIAEELGRLSDVGQDQDHRCGVRPQ